MWQWVFLGALSLPGIDVSVRPLAGPPRTGTLVSIQSDQMTLTRNGEQIDLALVDLWEVQPSRSDSADFPPMVTVWVELIDGSLLLADQYTVQANVATVHLTSQKELEVPTRAIRSVRLRDHSPTPHLAEQWRQILGEKPGGDTIVIARGESLDQLDGVLHDVSEETVAFEFDGDTISVKRTKLDGLIYYHPISDQRPSRLCLLTDASGSLWNCRSLTMNDGVLHFVSGAGVELDLPVQQLRKLDFSSGNTAWLSELEPESVAWQPFFPASSTYADRLTQMSIPRRDICFGQRPLTLDGVSYTKGLAIKSRTDLVYRLVDDYRQFHAIIGVDDQVGDGGSVDVEITADDTSGTRELFKRSIAGSDKAIEVNLDITGVRRLRILVDYGDHSDVGDLLDMCDARLTR